MTPQQLEKIHRNYIEKYVKYERVFFDKWNYNILSNVMYKYKAGRGQRTSYNECIFFLDTETSKEKENTIGINHIVCWTLTIRFFEQNIVTLYGRTPSECIRCIKKILDVLQGDETYFYIQNLSYDWVFLRKFLLEEFGVPENQLNTKPHYPIYIKFSNGLVLRDSLILAQRGLLKWGKDLNVEHQKAIGDWDYDVIRNQNTPLTDNELGYAEFDTLCGAECIDATLKMLNKKLYSIPYTATGIPREGVKKRGKKFSAKEHFNSMCLDFEQYKKATKVYHGGYTHANRHIVNHTIKGSVKCKDFASSYPFRLVAYKFPMEKFTKIDDCTIEDILSDEDNAYMFKLIMVDVCLKNDDIDMPVLQFSKCTRILNPILDNGRVLKCDYAEIYLTEIDLKLINKQYNIKKHLCTEVEFAYKNYLPRWLTDYVFELYYKKCTLKDVDDILYVLSKYTLNSIYGMMVQKSIRDDIEEDYTTGEYLVTQDENNEEKYNKYLDKIGSILPYQWGVYVTAYSLEALFELGDCADVWLYSDTDSCYALGWNEEKVEKLNSKYKQMLKDNGYDRIEFNNKTFWLGVAEDDKEYSEFRVLGSKRYCGRSTKDNKLHITVAGVPKIGAKCLNNNIDNFKKGFNFSGQITNKKTHTYFFVDDIYVDENGNEVGDSIDLSACDYLLNDIEYITWDELIKENYNIESEANFEKR